MNRRELLVRGAAAAAGTTLLGSSGGLFRPSSADAATGCLWGVHAEPRGGQDYRTALSDFEKLVGRTMAIDRQYYSWDEILPTGQMQWSKANGRRSYVAWHCWMNSNEGSAVPWRSIANGAQDSHITAQANSIKAWGAPIYLSFHHEPENDGRCGSADDFRAAYNHVRSRFDALGVRNVTWVLTLTAATYNGRHGGPSNWEPAASAYDLVGVDGYNRYPIQGHGYKSFSECFGTARAFARSRGKKLAIGEFGCVEQVRGGKGDPAGKGKWIADAGAVLQSWPEAVFACYSHTGSAAMGFWVDTSSPSLNAYRTVGHSAYFGG